MQDNPLQEDKPQNRGEKRVGKRDGARRGGADGAFLPLPDGSWSVASLIVARPGDTTIDIVLAAKDIQGRIEFWICDTKTVKNTPNQEFKAGAPCLAPRQRVSSFRIR